KFGLSAPRAEAASYGRAARACAGVARANLVATSPSLLSRVHSDAPGVRRTDAIRCASTYPRPAPKSRFESPAARSALAFLLAARCAAAMTGLHFRHEVRQLVSVIA